MALTAAVVMSASLMLAAPAQAKAAPDRTSAIEAKRVDRVPTPKLRWYACGTGLECTTVKLPLDYDKPKGAKTEVALLRVKARDRKRRIGSLFVNPGGPGGSSVEIAAAASQLFGNNILDRFDVVGMDPRGTNFSQQVKCFSSARTQTPVLTKLAVAFPVTAAQEKVYVAGSKQLGKACSTKGRPLSASMSTAEVARDMDVIRRAVGDKKLTYLGFSYGTYLGQVYANMFPDRVRALAIDGVLDPIGWAGTTATRNVPVTDRIRSGDGAAKALREILVRCDRAGGQRCVFAAGDPVANFELIANRLKVRPISEVDPFTGETFTFGYADLIGFTLGALYSPEGSVEIAAILNELLTLTEPPATRSDQRAATRAGVKRVQAAVAARQAKEKRSGPGRFGFPYDNSLETFTSVLCTDSVNPANASSWPAAADRADARAKHFGRLWIWASAPCASRTWTAKDEDAYRGPFTRRTSAPVLVVGNYWDPATNYQGAVKAAALLPNSRLLSSTNWGHIAFGTSDCATRSIENYLLSIKLPAKGKVCIGDSQPFTGDTNIDERTTSSKSAADLISPFRPPIGAMN